MTNSNTQEPNNTSRPAVPGSTPEVVGRRVGLVVYWLILLFVIIAGALSILPQAFTQSQGPTDTPTNNNFHGENR